MFKNNGNIYVTEKASKGKDIKVKSYRGGGMDMGNKSNQAKSAAMGSSSSKSPGHPSNQTTSPSTNRATSNNNSSSNSRTTRTTKTTKTNKNQFNTNDRDVPFRKPLNFAASMVASSFLPFLGTGVNLAAKQNYKARQKFATKEGLARDFYRMENKPLQPNSPIGKKYLKDAGFGKNKNKINMGGNDGPEKCPDGSLPPCTSVASASKKIDKNLVSPKDNFFNFKAYKVGGLSGGVRYGPPPKSGPNSQVPPIKLKKGSKK